MFHCKDFALNLISSFFWLANFIIKGYASKQVTCFADNDKEVQDSESEQTKQRALIKIIRTKLELKHS